MKDRGNLKNDLPGIDSVMMCTLLIDTGDGFEGQQIVEYKPTQPPATFTFDLSEYGPIKHLCFVPAQDICVIEVHDILVARSDQSVYQLIDFQSNSLYQAGNLLRFPTKSPRIILPVFNQSLKKITIRVTYRNVGDDALEDIVQFTLKTNSNQQELLEKTLKNQLEFFAEKIHQKAFDIHRLADQNKAISHKVDALYSVASKPWTQRLKSILKSVVSDLGKLFSRLWIPFSSVHDPYRIIEKSKLFDAGYYLKQYPDLIGEGIEPLGHYLRAGAFEGRDPQPLFDSAYYLKQADLHEAKPNPLFHYIETGALSGIDPHPLFDTTYYLNQNPDIAKSGRNPLIHYHETGALENKSPCPLFNASYYLDQNPDVAFTGINPLKHFMEKGAFEGRDPNPFFETTFYLTEYPDVSREGLNPLIHYIQSGANEGRKTGRYFDSLYYLENNPEIAKSGMIPLTHYLEFGAKKGNNPSLEFKNLSDKPTISIITPVFDVEETILSKCIRSVLNQIYPKWELCLVDDGSKRPHIKETLETYAKRDNRIKIQINKNNQGIVNTSNQAASMATGDYICFLDHDDELTKDALYEFVTAINQNNPDVLYSDEGVINRYGRYLSYICKPDYSPDLLFSFNYITHLLLVKKTLFNDVGGFSAGYDGAQDYDLVLRLVEQTEKIVHIPKVLYLWRQIQGSTSINPESKTYANEKGRKALQKALERRNINGKVLKTDRLFYYRVKRDVLNHPKVSIIIPFKDEPKHLKRCIESILTQTDYQNFTILGIDNGSHQNDTFALMDQLSALDKRICFHKLDIEFNFSKIMNHAVSLAKGDQIVLMNNDIEILSHDWLESLIEHAQRPEVGAVGAKLYYPDGKIQHAGVIIGIRGFAGHAHRNYPGDSAGYYHRLKSVQNMSAVTGALMMVKKRHYEEVGGLNEKNLAIALNDIDFCLKLRSKGYSNIFTPFCEAMHHESVSRGYEVSPENRDRFSSEIIYFKRKWQDFIENGDPFYNPNLTLHREDFSLNEKSRWQFDRLNRFKPIN